MTENKKASKGRPSSAGKRKGKFDRYFTNSAAKKLRNVRKHNGRSALAAYKDWDFECKVMANKQLLRLPPEPKAIEA